MERWFMKKKKNNNLSIIELVSHTFISYNRLINLGPVHWEQVHAKRYKEVQLENTNKQYTELDQNSIAVVVDSINRTKLQQYLSALVSYIFILYQRIYNGVESLAFIYNPWNEVSDPNVRLWQRSLDIGRCGLLLLFSPRSRFIVTLASHVGTSVDRSNENGLASNTRLGLPPLGM